MSEQADRTLEAHLVEIEKLIPGGRGMAVLPDGRRAFVKGGFPGDSGYLREVRSKATYVEADAFEVVRPSSDRVSPACSVFARCGGCDWMGLSLEAQLEAKREIVLDALARIGKLSEQELPSEIRLVQAPSSLAYRSRLRLKVSQGKVGFLAAKSHELVEFEDCLVATREVSDVLAEVRAAVARAPQAFAQVDHVEIRALSSEGASPSTTRSAHFVLQRKKHGGSTHPNRLLREQTRQLTGMQVRLGKEAAPFQLYQPAPGVSVEAPVGGFTQVNEAVNRLLVERVCSLAVEHGARTFVDVYCGSGNFSLPLLVQGLSGCGVERDPEAISAARSRSDAEGYPTEFFATESARCLEQLVREGRSFDMMIVDPPRAGAKDIVPLILRLAVPLLAMVSCDPTTLARDLRMLMDGGYRLVGLDLFDMFPQTHHVESLAVLIRS